MRLTAKEARFVDEYLIDLDPKRAALKAGYSPSIAASKAYQWVSNGKVKPLVFAAVEAAMAKRSARTEITQDKVLRELAKIGFTDLSAVVSWGAKEIAVGYDDEGNQLPPAQLGDAVLVRHELAPFVEAVPSEELAVEARAAVAEVALTKDGIRIKMHDKRAALQDIGRHLGMFKDKVEHSGPNGEPIQTEAVTRSHKDRAKAMALLLARQRP